jgi:hypothetical protein
MRPANSEATTIVRVACACSASSLKARIEMKIATVKPMPFRGAMAAIAAERAEPLDVNVVEHMTARCEVVQGALVSSARRAASHHAR